MKKIQLVTIYLVQSKVILSFASFIYKVTIHIIFQEVGRRRQRAAKGESGSAVRVFEPAYFTCKCNNPSRSTLFTVNE